MMCTIIVLNDCVPGYSLIIAANRDEKYDRQSSAPALRNLSNVDVIAPWDEKKDGTWIGVGREGWFVGLTNQDDGKHDENAKSRGGVVVDCLRANNHVDAAKVLSQLDVVQYNPFNIVFGRPGAMFLTRVLPGQPIEMQPLLDDVHVISNDCWTNTFDKKTQRGKDLLKSLIHDPPIENIDTVIGRIMITLADHRRIPNDDPFQSLCVHADQHNFGTRSTSIITVSNEGLVEYFYHDGHPCVMDIHLQKVGSFTQ